MVYESGSQMCKHDCGRLDRLSDTSLPSQAPIHAEDNREFKVRVAPGPEEVSLIKEQQFGTIL